MILEQIKKADLTSVAIFGGAGVDPDGLASAICMKAIVEKFGGSATCFHRGTFNRPQNKTMREVLSLDFKPNSEFDVAHSYTCIISVDGPAEVCPVRPDFIIDHHKPGKPGKIATDVREIGSCSAILWEYAMAADIDFEDESGKVLATALAIGILTDTDNYKVDKCSDLDVRAASFCLEKKDYKTFIAIQNCPIPAYYNDAYAKGWSLKKGSATVIVEPLGNIPSGRSGLISYLSEKYSVEGVKLSVVVAMVNNQILMSVRGAVDIQEFVDMFGSGGGKGGAGVAIINLPEPFFSNVDDVSRKDVFDSFFKIIVNKALEFAGDGAKPEQDAEYEAV